MKKIKNILKSITIFIGYFLITILLNSYIKNTTTSNNIVLNIYKLIPVIVIVLICLFIYRNELKNDLINFKKNYKEYLQTGIKYWLLGYLIMVCSNNIIVNIIGSISQNQIGNESIIDSLLIYSIIVMIILGPLQEEIMFRLNFKKCFKNDNLFCIITSLIFALGHVIGYSLIEYLYLIPYFAMGFILAKSYTKTNNIFTSISVHTFHNMLTMIMYLITKVI